MGHGIGVGDINGDGRKDVLNANGWWEQPEKDNGEPWRYHSAALGRYGHRSTGAGGAGWSTLAYSVWRSMPR